jgi:cytidine deaminase
MSGDDQIKVLRDAALSVRENAYAKESGFKVGAALRTVAGTVFAGCNVENVAYPEGTCAEAGAIAAMCAAGEYEIAEVYVVAQTKNNVPVPPCGGCRQKIREFTHGREVTVIMGTTEGAELRMTIDALLPGAFDASFMQGS